MLHVFFALQGILHPIKNLIVDELVDAVTLCMPRHVTVLVLGDAADQITGHADVDCSTGATGKDVDICLLHGLSVWNRDGRDKPGHDG